MKNEKIMAHNLKVKVNPYLEIKYKFYMYLGFYMSLFYIALIILQTLKTNHASSLLFQMQATELLFE